MSGPALPGFAFLASGKVRDLYTVDGRDDLLLLVADDRISAFDRVLPTPVPGRGALLTAITRWWLARLDIPNHLADGEVPVPETVAARAMLVRRLDMLPVECVVRGYMAGSGYDEYRAGGSISGAALPPGLVDGDRLPAPVFTPATKAAVGDHDENIPFDRVVDLVGEETAGAMRAASLDVYTAAAAVAERRGVMLADPKLEFGLDPATGALVLADEVLTPDSSRYWDAAAHAAGRRGVSFDKQIVRDWLRAHWDGTGDPPRLPEDVIRRTADRYRELLGLLTGDGAPPTAGPGGAR